MKKLKLVAVLVAMVSLNACSNKAYDTKIDNLEKQIKVLEMKIDSIDKQNEAAINAIGDLLAQGGADKALGHRRLNEDHRRFLNELSKNQGSDLNDRQLKYLKELEEKEKLAHPNRQPLEVEKIKPLLSQKSQLPFIPDNPSKPQAINQL